MISCPKCGMDNNSDSRNCWNCNFPLKSSENVKQVITDDESTQSTTEVNSKNVSKKLVIIPIFAALIIIIGSYSNWVNLQVIFSSDTLRENATLISLTLFLVGIFVCICLLGFLPIIRSDYYNQSIPIKKRPRILKILNKLNNSSNTYPTGEVSYKEVLMSNTLNIVLIPLILTITFSSLIYNNIEVSCINCLFTMITLIVGILVYILPDKLNSFLPADIRSEEGYNNYLLIAHIPLVLLVIMIFLNL